jgi:small GTP-binding protein
MSGVPRNDKPRLKLILVGHSGVGKTCLIASYLKKTYDPNGPATVSPAYLFQDMTRHDSLVVTLQIWDTAGQERYHAVSQMFYRDANFALVCFEATNNESTDSISDWVGKVRAEVPDCEFIFVATKSDTIPQNDREGVLNDWKKRLNGLQPKSVHLTSALTREGVEEVFKAAAELYVPRQQLTRIKERPEPRQPDQKGECAC